MKPNRGRQVLQLVALQHHLWWDARVISMRSGVRICIIRRTRRNRVDAYNAALRSVENLVAEYARVNLAFAEVLP